MSGAVLAAVLLALLLLVLLCVLAWLWWRRRAPRQARMPGTPVQLERRVFARALRTLHPRDADYRYDKPCVLVCGAAASGKSALLRGAGLEALALQDGVDSGWWRSPEGVAFELPSAAWEADSGAWRAFLRLIERHRSVRALDAIVWTLPFPEPGQAPADGEHMYRKLVELQDRLGLALPVYVVLSGCERAAGFAEWAALLPAATHAHTLGWSNPHPPQGPARRDLPDTGVATIAQRLRRLVSALTAQRGPGEHGPSMFLMPERIAAGLAELPAALRAALRPNAVLTPFTLRGIYLSGRAAGADAASVSLAGSLVPYAADPFAPVEPTNPHTKTHTSRTHTPKPTHKNPRPPVEPMATNPINPSEPTTTTHTS